ncbi:hypothetical protein [Prochlorococcus marinus]|uniref:Possible LEM domain n=1 Tax=Prochlorococcus marinus (strain MIT 9211) TaxID=93059 RepID=A9BA31_PROM4|nr:hypothetical protein [Prochlorococcus marinus]ABX08693.1 possible LEM domain [Prochlorococcus marinus str. MIT 9211]
MNFTLHESALIKPVMQSIANLALVRQRKGPAETGILYTLCESDKSNLIIGYTKEARVFTSFTKIEGLRLLGKKFGSKRELDLIKITLKEVGFACEANQCIYKSSPKMIRLLKMLGWPIESNLNPYKKKLSI